MAEKVPHVTPVTATTINGITYFKLEPDPKNPRYSGDYTKKCGLLGNEIDENFFYLRNVYIYTAYTQTIDGVRNLVLERVNGDKIYVDLNDESSYVVDDEGHIIVDGHPIKDENGEPVSFLIKGRDVHIVTDASTQGDGSYGKPIGVDLAYRTGTYSPADFFVDLTCGGKKLSDFTDIGCGHSIVTRENAGRFGALYTFTQAQKLNAALNREYGERGWRVPSREDWAKLLNWAEGCDGIKNHDTTDCRNLGKFAGKRLKSVGFWDYENEDKKPVDEFGFSVYPVGICPEIYNAAQPETEFGYDGLYGVSTFWSSTMSHGQAYTRTFSYAHNDVEQSTDSVKKRYSIRLVRDVDEDFDVKAYEFILNNYLPVILTTDGKQLWTAFNIEITNYEGYDDKEITVPSAWTDVETNIVTAGFYWRVPSGDTYEYVQIGEEDIPSTAIVETVTEIPEPESTSPEYIRYEYNVHIDMSSEPKFFFNAWDGSIWHKKMMTEGESVIILNEDYPNNCISAATYVNSGNTNHEWRIFFDPGTGLDELVDTVEALRRELEEIIEELVGGERERAISAETALHEEIVAETDRAISAETELHEEIVAEIERAISAETALQEEIEAEIERAISAETVLHEEIVAETERAMSAETELHEEILEEASARTEVDEYLQEQIDELKAKTIDPGDDSIVIEVSGSSTTIRVQISEAEKQLKLSDGTAVEYYDSAGHPIYIPKGLYIDQDFGEFEG